MSEAKRVLELSYLPPSKNRIRRMVFPKGGGRPFPVLTAEAREWRDQIRDAWTGLHYGTLEGWLRLDLDVVWPDLRERDCANLFEFLLDCLQREVDRNGKVVFAGAYPRDSRVLPSVRTVRYRKGDPGLRITIYPVEQGAVDYPDQGTKS